jgi:hypothetical protein
MTTIEKLYQATQESSLSDYALFNRDDKEREKNKFLSLITKALNNSEWFKISDFQYLGKKTFRKDATHVPFADKATKTEEYNALLKVFNEDEIKELIKIVEKMESYGVNAIKELMDEEEPKKNRWMRSAFLNPFISRK